MKLGVLIVPGQGRLGDKANVALDAHGCPACPHPAIGPAIQGSPDVNVNRRPALRVDDPGIHAACCGTNTWKATNGSLTVFINGKGAHRMGDQNRHCGGIGQLVEGSPNVLVGEVGGSSQPSSTERGPNGASSAGGGPGAVTGSNEGSHGAGAAAEPAASTNGDAATAASTLLTWVELDLAASTNDDAATATSRPLTWIELELVGDDDRPIAGERFLLTASDGQVRTGILDRAGRARIEDITEGRCTVTLPDLDADVWTVIE